MSVVSMRMSVDLPAPFGPSRPKISPSSTAKLMPSTAVKSPKRFVICRVSTWFMAGPFPSAGVPSQPPVAVVLLLPRRDGQQNVYRHADGQAPVRVVHAQTDLEGFDVALLAAHVALGGE